MTFEIDRRQFIQNAAAVTAAVAVTSPGARGVALGSNERVRLGVIGVGNRGDQLLDAFLPHKDAQIVALCDVYEPYLHAAQSKVGGHAELHGDYRELLDRKDIDAVIIATPDHWHALQTIDACRAGKDVYIEKPLSLTISEGRQMAKVAHDTRRITQVGLHRRSSKVFHEAVERIRNGEIGHVTSAHCHFITNEFPVGIGNPADSDPPPGLNWDLWLGPAPKVPFNPNRCLYKFRWFRDYSGGQVTNQGAHYLDVIQWALGKEAPKVVLALGGKYAVEDNRDIPDTMEVVWQYDGGTLVTFSQHNANSSQGRRAWDIEFCGTKGTLGFAGDGFEIVPESNRLQPLPALSPLDRAGNRAAAKAVELAGKPVKVPGENTTKDHARNFLDCVKSRRETNCPIETGHRSTTATLLANVALDVGRAIQWDADREQVLGDHEANGLLARQYRAPWSLGKTSA
jgi:predicted dehydrogenase